jgi:hypothetical protein
MKKYILFLMLALPLASHAGKGGGGHSSPGGMYHNNSDYDSDEAMVPCLLMGMIGVIFFAAMLLPKRDRD